MRGFPLVHAWVLVKQPVVLGQLKVDVACVEVFFLLVQKWMLRVRKSNMFRDTKNQENRFKTTPALHKSRRFDSSISSGAPRDGGCSRRTHEVHRSQFSTVIGFTRLTKWALFTA